MKTKWKWNYLIDAAMFLLMMAVAGIGLLMKYVLPHGRDVQLKYGTMVEPLFLGLDRHWWGKTHFVVSLILLVLLALHIILHWSQVLAFFRNLVPSRRVRLITAWGFTLGSLVLLAFPLVVRPELAPKETLRQFARQDTMAFGRGRYVRTDTLARPSAGEQPRAEPATPRRQSAVVSGDTAATAHVAAEPAGTRAEHEEHTLLLQGYMSLQEISTMYEVPVSHLLEKLEITDSRLARERLGRIRRSYGFTMGDIEDIIRAYWIEHPPTRAIPPGLLRG